MLKNFSAFLPLFLKVSNNGVLRTELRPHYTGCHRRKGPNFGRVFLMLNYTDITQNTYPKLNGYGGNDKRSLKL